MTGCVYSDLERISAIEASAESRPSPKHDVLSVMTYIRQKLPSNPLDEALVVDEDRVTNHYRPILDHWLGLHARVQSYREPSSGKLDLSAVVQNITNEYGEFGLDCGEMADLNASANGMQGSEVEDALTEEDLYTCPPKMPAPTPQAAPNTRRKSAVTTDAKSMPIIPATDLPIAFLLRDLARRLCSLFDYAFATIADSAQIIDATPVITWQPPEVEEDDALALLGLARDPTKISSRTIRADDETEASVFIACESPPNSLPKYTIDFPACELHAPRLPDLSTL